MKTTGRTNLLIGLIFVALGCVAAFVWIPLDTQTGLIEKVRGRQIIGDALAPTIASGFLLLGGLLLVLTERNAPNQPTLTRQHLSFITRILAVIIIGVLVMRYTGPALSHIANVFRDDLIAYRLLRATLGWRHVGFVLGGILIVAGLIATVEGRLTRRAILTALAAVLLIIAVFDIPFEDLLLPPNGDV